MVQNYGKYPRMVEINNNFHPTCKRHGGKRRLRHLHAAATAAGASNDTAAGGAGGGGRSVGWRLVGGGGGWRRVRGGGWWRRVRRGCWWRLWLLVHERLHVQRCRDASRYSCNARVQVLQVRAVVGRDGQSSHIVFSHQASC